MEFTNIKKKISIVLPKVEDLKMKKLIFDETKCIKGVYFLYNDSLELIYIGKTLNFRNRMCSHIRTKRECTSLKEKVHYYSFLKINNMFESKMIELIYLVLYRTKYNSVSI